MLSLNRLTVISSSRIQFELHSPVPAENDASLGFKESAQMRADTIGGRMMDQ